MNNKVKVLLNSLWILLDIPGFLFGFLTGVGMIIAGKKVGEKRWITLGWIFIAVLGISEAIGIPTQGQKISTIALDIYVVGYIAAVICSIVILVKFIPRFSKKLEGKSVVQASAKENTVGISPAKYTVSKDLYSVANNTTPEKKASISFDNSYYDSLNIAASTISTKAPTKIEKAKQKAEIIDINTCTEQELASLPGVSVVAAKKAIAFRDSNNGFASEDEFYKAAGVQLHFVKQIKDKIRCGEDYVAVPQEVDVQKIEKNVSEAALVTEPSVDKEKKGRVLDI